MNDSAVCGACPIAHLCPSYGEGETDPEKARKLLEADVEERPFTTLKHRQEYLREVAGISVSESTLSRTIRSMGFGRKKGRWVRVSETSL